MPEPLNVGLVGFGNIGAGVLRALQENRRFIDARVPHPISVTRIVDLDVTTKRDASYDPNTLSKDIDGLLADPDIHVVLELTGTMDFAYGLIERALRAGKHVVTANKALMATCGVDLIRIAVEQEVCLLFEASVGGGIPLLRTLHQGLAANDILGVRGIINGTANYILTRMTEEDLDFDVALEEAQKLGYAEPDPTFDVEGQDTAHKLALLATLCFGQDIRFEDVYREGITRISRLDIEYTRDLGYNVKLLGIAKRDEQGRIETRVHPTLLPRRSRLAGIGGVYNAVRIDGNLTGSVILSGRGAGPEPTASAVISDLMALASGKAEGGLRREMRLSMPTYEKRLRPMSEVTTDYYLRLALADVPGALAQVFSALGKHGVSVASMMQPREHAQGCAPVLLVTHQTTEEQLQRAFHDIEVLDINCERPLVLRIENMG